MDEQHNHRLGANGEITRQEVLRALAWAAPFKTAQLHRIVAPAMRITHFRDRVLQRMRSAGLIEALHYYVSVQATKRAGTRPKRLGYVWKLTAAGFAEIAGDDASPQRPALVRASVLDHDLMMSEAITRIIELTRPILSSIYVEHEERLDETRRRPIADAMLVVRYDPSQIMTGMVPWKSLPPAPDEAVRLYAIEIDRNTEQYSITNAKAENYRNVRSDPAFYERYGRMFPVLLITVPTEARLRSWHAGWKERWPDGKWLITTDAGLRSDTWLEHWGGSERQRTFVDDWQPGQGMRRPDIQTSSGANGTMDHIASRHRPTWADEAERVRQERSQRTGGGSHRPT